MPGRQLEGRTDIGPGARIGPGCLLRDTSVGEDARPATASAVGRDRPGATVGPYAFLRPGTRIGPAAHIGTHVELKNADVGRGRQGAAPDLRGRRGHRRRTRTSARARSSPTTTGWPSTTPTIGEHVFIGSNTVLVAPVTIGDGAYTAAGSVITEDVPPGALGVARGTAAQLGRMGGAEAARHGSAAAAARARQPESRGPEAPAADEDEGEQYQVSGMTASSAEEDDARSRPGIPGAGRRGGRLPGHRADAGQALSTSPTARSSSGSSSRSAAATCSCCRATPRRSTSGSWSS